MRIDDTIPARGGLGLKAEHYRDVLSQSPDIGFFEIHAENYMGAGGPPHRYLEAIRERYPLSLHGVGLSIGGTGPLDVEHLARLKTLDALYEPGLFSEHLAWSTHAQGYLADLLPLPYTGETLQHVARHIDQVQDTLGRQMLLENPSSYLAFEESTYSEPDFIREAARRTGCGLLLDVNNIFVSATNLGFGPEAYVDQYPTHLVQEIHLAGHSATTDSKELPLLIDDHASPVSDPVWDLYSYVVSRIGPVPTLIERDADVPPLTELIAEAQRADRLLAGLRRAA
jgi:hypothetical protein